MFKFLKDTLKKTVSAISEKIKDTFEAKEKPEVKEEPIEDMLEEKFAEEVVPPVEAKKEDIKIEEKEEIEEKEAGFEEKDEEIEEKREEKKVEIPKRKLDIFVARQRPKKIEKPEERVEQKEERKEELKEEIKQVEEEKIKVAEKKPEVKSKPEVFIQEQKLKPKEQLRPEPKAAEVPQKRGFFQKLTEKITTTTISGAQFEELFWDLEVALLENNVAVEVIEKIKKDLTNDLVNKPIPRNRIVQSIQESLKRAIKDVLKESDFDLEEAIKEKKKTGKPYIICFVGINGSGKTTTIAKVTHRLKKKGFSVVLAAADTFRAAAIDQLEEHANRLGVKLIKHDYGSDPAAVAFDAIKHAEAKKADVVLIDTAGRMHSNQNLQDEMKKIMRVAKPDLKIFVGESITGNDCVEQAKKFNESITIDGIILAKADIDEKGGAALSVSFVTNKPVLYLGTGQQYDDLKVFDPEQFLEQLGLA